MNTFTVCQTYLHTLCSARASSWNWLKPEPAALLFTSSEFNSTKALLPPSKGLLLPSKGFLVPSTWPNSALLFRSTRSALFNSLVANPDWRLDGWTCACKGKSYNPVKSQEISIFD